MGHRKGGHKAGSSRSPCITTARQSTCTSLDNHTEIQMPLAELPHKYHSCTATRKTLLPPPCPLRSQFSSKLIQYNFPFTFFLSIFSSFVLHSFIFFIFIIFFHSSLPCFLSVFLFVLLLFSLAP